MSFVRSLSARSWMSIRTANCCCRNVNQSINRSINQSFNQLIHRSFGSVATHTIPEPAPHIIQSLSQSMQQNQSVNQSNIAQPNLSQSLNQAFNQTVELTDAASARIGQLRSKHGPQTALRLSIDSGGCSGMSYKFEIDTAGPEEGDQIFTTQNDPENKLLVDSLSLEHLAGSIIDYRSRIERSGFEVVANPNAAGKCGCGTSFQPKNF